MKSGQTKQYPHSLEPLIEYHQRLRRGYGPDPVDEPPPEPFLSWVREIMAPRENLQYWVSTMRDGEPRTDGDWIQGFPHKHDWGRQALTMICYLTTGGDLVVFRGPGQTNPVTVTPAPGLCAFVDGEDWHGVRPNHGPDDRTAIIVTAGRTDEREDAGDRGAPEIPTSRSGHMDAIEPAGVDSNADRG